MPVPTLVTTPGEEPGRRVTPAAVDFSQRCEAALRRLDEQKSTPDQPDVQPAEAHFELAPADRPPMRYLLGRNARATSQKTYRTNLRTVQGRLAESGFSHGDESVPAEDFPWHLVGPGEAAVFMAHMNATYSNPHTVATLTTALRCVVRECGRSGLMSQLRCQRVLESLPVRAVPPGRKGRELSDDEIARLFAACDGESFIGSRDAAMIAIAARLTTRYSRTKGVMVALPALEASGPVGRRPDDVADRLGLCGVGEDHVGDGLHHEGAEDDQARDDQEADAPTA